jgi:hypothetical protein
MIGKMFAQLNVGEICNNSADFRKKLVAATEFSLKNTMAFVSI